MLIYSGYNENYIPEYECVYERNVHEIIGVGRCSLKKNCHENEKSGNSFSIFNPLLAARKLSFIIVRRYFWLALFMNRWRWQKQSRKVLWFYQYSNLNDWLSCMPFINLWISLSQVFPKPLEKNHKTRFNFFGNERDVK